MIDRQRFFDRVRAWGKLTQSQVDGLNTLLDCFESDPEMTDLRWISYALATVKHEAAGTYKPIAEYGKGRGKPYGKKDPETGETYYGRGFVQITWRRNYDKLGDEIGVDLVNQPDLAMSPEIAYQILSIGMREGLFTGRKLSHYIDGAKCDYLNARKIINAMDKAQLIAGYAKRFETILKESTEDDPPILNGGSEPATVATSTTTTVETAEGKTEEKTSFASSVVSADKAKEIAGTGLSTIGNKLATGGISGGVISAVGAFLEKAWPLLIFAAVLIILGFITWWLIYNAKQKQKIVEGQIAADPTRKDITFGIDGKAVEKPTAKP